MSRYKVSLGFSDLASVPYGQCESGLLQDSYELDSEEMVYGEALNVQDAIVEAVSVKQAIFLASKMVRRELQLGDEEETKLKVVDVSGECDTAKVGLVGNVYLMADDDAE